MTISGKQRGKLKIFMGYAPGVGKTYKMLEESQGLKSQGVDIVVGYFESHGRPDTIAKTKGSRSCPGRESTIAGPNSKRWTPMLFWRDIRACVSSMNFRTPMSQV